MEKVLKECNLYLIRESFAEEVQNSMYAVIENGGKQYKVSEGDVFTS